MKRTLEKFEAINSVDLLICKYMSAQIERPDNHDNFEVYVRMLRKVNNHISSIHEDLEVEVKHSLNLTRVVAIQNREIEQLKIKIKHLEKGL